MYLFLILFTETTDYISLVAIGTLIICLGALKHFGEAMATLTRVAPTPCSTVFIGVFFGEILEGQKPLRKGTPVTCSRKPDQN